MGRYNYICVEYICIPVGVFIYSILHILTIVFPDKRNVKYIRLITRVRVEYGELFH